MSTPALAALAEALRGEPFDYRAYQHQMVLEELRLFMWCRVHDGLRMFCDHKHAPASGRCAGQRG